MDANQICYTLSRASSVARAYDYKTTCGHTDVCEVIRDYFAQKFVDLSSDCDGSDILIKHVVCKSYPAVPPTNITSIDCPISVTEVDPVDCGTIAITIVQ